MESANVSVGLKQLADGLLIPSLSMQLEGLGIGREQTIFLTKLQKEKLWFSSLGGNKLLAISLLLLLIAPHTQVRWLESGIHSTQSLRAGC